MSLVPDRMETSVRKKKGVQELKIAFDVDVLAKQMSINDMVHQVADWGYKYFEQSPHPRINPFYKHPHYSRECEAEYRKALQET